MSEKTDSIEERPSTKTPILVLAGGKGTRLQSVDPTKPKPMVEIHKKPFLLWLLQHYRDQSFNEFLISTGHLAEVIETFPWKKHFSDAKFKFFREPSALGSGGAIQYIFQKNKKLDACWVINGDTFLSSALPDRPDDEFEAFYCVLQKENVFDAQPNLLAEDEYITEEVQTGLAHDTLYFDAGAVYITRKAVERYKGPVPCSVHDLLYPTMSKRRVGFEILDSPCYDIGTPERLKRFEEYLKKHA